MMVLGREVPADVMFGHIKATNETTNSPVFVIEIKSRMGRAHDVTRNQLEANAKRSKEVYDARLSLQTYEAGDVVCLLHDTRRVGVSAKLQNAFDGPFLVTARYPSITL
ncbi:hypothetical protein DPMN_027893 [Dreissena polymorpha]|uniref:Uncharacterized protein n=1 Tax=Dreissena polymorpha TaxID=45954 RepID=A0A9D4LTP8_DREPO|nr:hypothetical protein DPMN_027893 [Dreissena polymorpha]